MIKQMLILIIIVLADLSVPSFEKTFLSITTGEFIYGYFFRNIFVSYFMGIVIEYTIYTSLKNKITIKPWVRFTVQLIASLVIESLMMFYLLALMLV